MPSYWDRDTLWSEGDSAGQVIQTRWELFARAVGIHYESNQPVPPSHSLWYDTSKEAHNILGSRNVMCDS